MGGGVWGIKLSDLVLLCVENGVRGKTRLQKLYIMR